MNNIKIKLKTSELTGAALDWAVAIDVNFHRQIMRTMIA
jgi:hypothetical protein